MKFLNGRTLTGRSENTKLGTKPREGSVGVISGVFWARLCINVLGLQWYFDLTFVALFMARGHTLTNLFLGVMAEAQVNCLPLIGFFWKHIWDPRIHLSKPNSSIVLRCWQYLRNRSVCPAAYNYHSFYFAFFKLFTDSKETIVIVVFSVIWLLQLSAPDPIREPIFLYDWLA